MIKMFRFFLVIIIFFQLSLLGMFSKDEEQQVGCPFSNKRTAMLSLFVFSKEQTLTHRTRVQDFQAPLLQTQHVSFSIKKYVIAYCEALLKFLCFGSSYENIEN